MIQTKEIIKYIKDLEGQLIKSRYRGSTILVKSFLITVRRFIEILNRTESSIIRNESIAEVTFNSEYYREMINSISSKLAIKTRLSKKIFTLSKIEKIKEAMKVNLSEIQLDFSKMIDLRLGLIIIIFNYYLLSYQINNLTIEFCNQNSLMNLVDILDKRLSSGSLFPVSIPSRLTNSFSNSLEFKSLLIQNRDFIFGSKEEK